MRKKGKRLSALLLAVLMLAALLTGCGKTDDSKNSSAPNSENSGAGADADSSEIDTSEHVDLKMYLIGDKPDGIDKVYGEINKILEEEINCSVTVDWLSWAEHDTKYSLLFSGQEDFDLIFTASTWGHFEPVAALGGFKALSEDFIQTYAPDIWAVEPEMAWKQATLDGSIYMVPANYREVSPDTVAVRGDVMEKLGYDDMKSWDELIDFYKDCAADGIYGNSAGAGSLFWLWFEQLGYATVGGAPSAGQLVLYHCVDHSDTEMKYILDWDEFDDFCKDMKALASENCWPTDVLNSTADRQDGLLNGTGATMAWNVGSCGIFANQANAEHPEWDVNVYNIMPDIPYTATKYINGGMAINEYSSNPERAMMALNQFFTNPAVQDLAQLGVEGENWKAEENNQFSVIEGNKYDASNYWGWRNEAIMREEYHANPTAVDTKVAELKEYYMSHIKEEHIFDSYAFDTSKVSTQYAAVEAVMGTYFDPLINGLVDDVDASLAEFRAALDSAGVGDVLEEMQSQMDALKTGE